MIGKLLKLLKKSELNNQRGSTLSMAIVVIAVLSFTVTTVTSATINLSSSTTYQLESSDNESVGRGLITQAISELEVFKNDGNSFDEFNATEISRILADYNVIVEDVTASYPDFDDTGEVISKVYRFSYLLDNGNTLVKYVYLSSSGTNLDTPHPFNFSLGTNGDLILNGGYYEEVDMYGSSIYFSRTAPWYEDDTYNANFVSPSGNGTYPDIEQNGDSSFIFFEKDYMYCNDDDCFTVDNLGNPYVIDKSAYSDVDGSSLPEQGIIQGDHITDFFSSFDYEAYFAEKLTQDLPNESATISDTMTLLNWETVIRNNMDVISYRGNGTVRSYPNTAYYDITNDSNYDFTTDVNMKISGVVDNNLTINGNVNMTDFEGEALVVLGDLTIDNTSNQISTLKGTFVVSGNLEFVGNAVEFNRAIFIVLGETVVDLNDGEELETKSAQFAFTIIGYDNIRIESVNETNSNTNVNAFVGFFYSEQSIWIDAINSKININGALYAKGAGGSINPIPMVDELGNQINGIVINSYKGYVDTSGGSPIYVPSNDLDDNRFYITKIQENRFTKSFLNFPDFENTTVSEGDVSIDTSEWIYE